MEPCDLGVLGGMGPLASTAFLDTLYRLNALEPEQRAPSCVLWSDPRVPDRTRLLADGRADELESWLRRGLERLADLGARRLVVTCVTAHAVLPRLSEGLRRRTYSLLDLALAELLPTVEPFLPLLTLGTRRAGVFESHPAWPRLAAAARWPSEAGQEEIHALIYRLKAGEGPGPSLAAVARLAREAGARRVLCGCTELHLLARAVEGGGDGGGLVWCDPLTALARRWPLDPAEVLPAAVRPAEDEVAPGGSHADV